MAHHRRFSPWNHCPLPHPTHRKKKSSPRTSQDQNSKDVKDSPALGASLAFLQPRFHVHSKIRDVALAITQPVGALSTEASNEKAWIISLDMSVLIPKLYAKIKQNKGSWQLPSCFMHFHAATSDQSFDSYNWHFWCSWLYRCVDQRFAPIISPIFQQPSFLKLIVS